MVVEELVPRLESEYRLIPEARARATMGFFISAQVTLLTVLDHPGFFSKVAVQAVRLLPPISDAVLAGIDGLDPETLHCYVAWNLYERRDSFYSIDYRRDSMRIYEALKARGLAVGGGEFPGAGGWSSIRARTDSILRAFFPVSRD